MLEPNSRRLLMESLQPPDGYHLDWAVGTTYTLDLMALLTAPVAFAFSDWQDQDGQPTCDPLALLKAVRQYAGRVCIFCQAGKIHVPKAFQPLLAGLEDSIVEATAPLGGRFHPKMWFLRFVESGGAAVRYRVLCASRNMTFDRSWDTLLCLEERSPDRKEHFRIDNRPLCQFVEALPSMSVRPMAATWKRRMAQLAEEIKRVKFEIPDPFDEIDFWPLGLLEGEPWPFPERIERFFVVSPFVDDFLLRDLGEWKAPIDLLCRSESMDLLSSETLELIDKAWVLDETANPEAAYAEQDEQTTATETADDLNTGDCPLTGLHAKAYLADYGRTASVFTGSANATSAGFNRNVEFLTELRGRKSKCGISAILGEGSASHGKRASTFADLLQRYTPVQKATGQNAELRDFERRVECFAQALAEVAPEAHCEQDGPAGMFGVQILGTKRLKVSPSIDWKVHVRPASLSDLHLAAATLSAPIWAEFRPLSLPGLTSFFVFEIESEKPKCRRRFVLNVPLRGVPENRHEAILRDLLSDRGRVLKFLLLMLQDTSARDLGNRMQSAPHADGQSSPVHSLFGATLLESLMKTLDRDPERLDQVAQVIRDLQVSTEGQDLLPADLDAIWAPIWAVRQRQIERRREIMARKDEGTGRS